MCVGGGQIGPCVCVWGGGGGPVRQPVARIFFWGGVCVFWRRRGIFAIGFPFLLTRNIHRPIYLPEE